MNPRHNPFWPFGSIRAAEPVAPTPPTPSEAAKVLSDCARANKVKRAATLNALRECVATRQIAKLEWRA